MVRVLIISLINLAAFGIRKLAYGALPCTRISSASFTIGLFGILLFCNEATSQMRSNQTNGSLEISIVQGSVFEPSSDSGLYRPLFRAFVQKQGFSREMTLTADNKFEVSIPSGFYEVVLKAGGKRLPYKRANFYIASGKTTRIMIADLETGVEFCDAQDGFLVVPDDGSLGKRPLPRFDSFILERPYKMVVKYCRKQIKNGKLFYDNALMTYKNLIVFSAVAVFDQRSGLFMAAKDAHLRVLNSETECVRSGRKLSVRLKTNSAFGCDDSKSISGPY